LSTIVAERDVVLPELVEPARRQVALVQPLDLPLVAALVSEARVDVHGALKT
jgi:hypothetical protein